MSMEDLLSAQLQISTAIEQLYSNFKKDGSDRKTSDNIKRRLGTLDSYWNEYQSNDKKLCEIGTKSHSYFTSSQIEQTEERYNIIKAAIQSYTTSREDIRPSTPLINKPTHIGVGIQDISSQARGSNSKTDEMLRKQSSNFKAFEHTILNIDLNTVSEKWEFDHLLRSIQSRVNVDSWDPLIIHLMCQKLDTETLNEYLLSVKEIKEVPKLDEFLSFLEKTFTVMETSRRKSEPKSNQNYKYQKTYKNVEHMKESSTGRSIAQPVSDRNVYATKYFKCAICKTNSHGIFNCIKFRELSPSVKLRTTEKLQLCENCLYSHYGKECISEKRCRDCNQAHNTLLHEAFTQHNNETGARASTSSSANVSTFKQGQRPSVRSSHVSLQPEIPEILLATAVIRVEKEDGSYVNMRALLDQGSQTSLITENAAQLLGLPRKRCQGVITGIGAKQSNCKGAINIKCVSTNRWILSGCARTLQCNIILNYLEEIPKWEIEDIAEESNLSMEDQECIEYHKSTTIQREDGRYGVRLPLKSDYETSLGLSKNRGVAQFKSLKRKFTKNQQMEKSYKSFMKEYQTMGHMTLATTSFHPHCVAREYVRASSPYTDLLKLCSLSSLRHTCNQFAFGY
ncbi:Uncharacterized protein OBRU01_15913 [Operophtera brumata]|uniref:Peptidase A2 domain-containing protein n=1 Tax=Operophtera brumata TaxID=104452 RepID=A0A0L7L479_OPEBR|nr:Uncharacterized protein OBRU01_15913 [Operophtera brumata]